jgi:SAM-dependent methyltransferase
MAEALLLFWLRPARRKARLPAVTEALRLLRDCGATAPPGGPLSDQKGVFWISVPEGALEQVQERLPRLGYTAAVDILAESGATRGRRSDGVRWRGREWEVIRLYEENEEALREQAPDRRPFLIEKQPGVVEVIQGYRGDGGPLSRRGLPVCDCRLLVNLVGPLGPGQRFLDPFAGVGGLLIEARATGCQVISSDIDPFLRHGLAALANAHHVGDARSLPLADASADAISTEPPYHLSARDTVIQALDEMHRILAPGGALAMLCAADQADALCCRALQLGFVLFLNAPIDRKGTDVVVLAWEKAEPGGAG